MSNTIIKVIASELKNWGLVDAPRTSSGVHGHPNKKTAPKIKNTTLKSASDFFMLINNRNQQNKKEGADK